jgi:hypothetical protein
MPVYSLCHTTPTYHTRTRPTGEGADGYNQQGVHERRLISETVKHLTPTPGNT